jgi:hypothetical protein
LNRPGDTRTSIAEILSEEGFGCIVIVAYLDRIRPRRR